MGLGTGLSNKYQYLQYHYLKTSKWGRASSVSLLFGLVFQIICHPGLSN
ncbi:5402_t:CDS:2, partial [Gigaspora margarita]